MGELEDIVRYNIYLIWLKNTCVYPHVEIIFVKTMKMNVCVLAIAAIVHPIHANVPQGATV
jgi:hypothetical protein